MKKFFAIATLFLSTHPTLLLAGRAEGIMTVTVTLVAPPPVVMLDKSGNPVCVLANGQPCPTDTAPVITCQKSVEGDDVAINTCDVMY